ncbi:hypothetical protein BLNAU_13124 [Blattamonas nauphoetae]|uniref:Uncharacterized protein n=1 Tax=Blattamonas nauphoetae TaxID=2049346 RepID=A0ABQ9XKL5_9EUKA|nr:hypothetical protein BLNAU_13124 [Blattamonas nauphoetae]
MVDIRSQSFLMHAWGFRFRVRVSFDRQTQNLIFWFVRPSNQCKMVGCAFHGCVGSSVLNICLITIGWIDASQRKLIQDVSIIPKNAQSKTQLVSISPPTLIRFVFMQASQTPPVTLDEKSIVCSFEAASGSLLVSLEAPSAGTIIAASLCARIDMLVVATSGGMPGQAKGKSVCGQHKRHHALIQTHPTVDTPLNKRYSCHPPHDSHPRPQHNWPFLVSFDKQKDQNKQDDETIHRPLISIFSDSSIRLDPLTSFTSASSHPSRLARIARPKQHQLRIGFRRSFSDGFSDSVSPSVLPGDSRPSQKGPLEWHVDSGLYALLETDPRTVAHSELPPVPRLTSDDDAKEGNPAMDCDSHARLTSTRPSSGTSCICRSSTVGHCAEESVRVGLLQSVALSLHHLLCFSLTPFDFLNAHLVSIGSSFRFLFGFFIRLVLPLVSLHCLCPPLRQTISATLLVFFASSLDSASGFFHTLPSDILSSLIEGAIPLAPHHSRRPPQRPVSQSSPLPSLPLSDGTCEAERVRRFLPVVAVCGGGQSRCECIQFRRDNGNAGRDSLPRCVLVAKPGRCPAHRRPRNSPSSSFVISKSGHATPIDVWNDLQVIIQWKNESITATLEDNTLPVKGRDRKESESFLSVTPRRCASLGCLGHAERVALFNKSGDVEPSDDADLLPLGGGLILSGGGECVAVRICDKWDTFGVGDLGRRAIRR